MSQRKTLWIIGEPLASRNATPLSLPEENRLITYLYWGLVIALIVFVLWLGGGRLNNWRGAFIAAAVILFVGWAAYYFHFQQVFVKRWGGVMRLTVPAGQQHLQATWKDDNLWIENYDPATNTCHFTEYSKGNLLEGRVIIRNCNPLGAPIAPPSPDTE
ncbi:MAG: hypothetical protein RBS88_02345 [Spongiibacteraceae bacterium]|nr:hypothetical protein [Spongiibacteraceae bacterium]